MMSAGSCRTLGDEAQDGTGSILFILISSVTEALLARAELLFLSSKRRKQLPVGGSPVLYLCSCKPLAFGDVCLGLNGSLAVCECVVLRVERWRLK